MSYTPTNWANGKAPALNATNLNKIEQKLKELDNIVSVPDITETTETTMPNSYDGRLLVNEIGGVCEQITTTGKQLFDKNTITSGMNVGADGNLYSDAKSFSTGYIPVSGLPNIVTNMRSDSNGNTWGVFFTENKVKVSAFNSSSAGGYVFAVPSGAYYVRIGCLLTLLDTAIVASGNVLPAYEPYTGGLPAPSPSYPQEIKKSVVSGVKTHGKNFINQPCVNANESGKHFLKAGTYTVSRNESETNNNWYLGAYDSKGNIITQNAIVTQDWALNGSQEFFYGGHACNFATFTLTVDCYVKIGSLNGDGKTYFMLNAGTTVLPYEPYTESSITLSKPIDLYGIGDVQDVIEDGKVKRRIGKVRLSGDWSWNKHGAGSGFYTYQSLGQASMSDGKNGIFTHFTVGNLTADKKAFFGFASGGNVQLRHDALTSTDALKEWLNANEVYACFLLAEEVIEELPLADQIALNSLSTYDGITYLEFDSELQPTFEGEYGTSKVGGYTLEALLIARNK